MAQHLAACASCPVELRKLGEADVSDDDASSRSTRSGSPSERSSVASRTSIARSFVWADADSDDDLDVAPSAAFSAGTGNQQSIFGGNPLSVPRVPPGCNQPFQVCGVSQQWAIVAVSPSFVACTPSACVTQPVQLADAGWSSDLVKQSAAQVPAVQRDSLQANTEAQSETQAEPKSKVAAEQLADDSRTTLILRNLPAVCTHDDLRRLLDEVGLAGLYDFIYVPFHFKKLAALGYGFVNFRDHEGAAKALATLDGFSGWAVDGQKACEVEWSGAQQGLHANVERYRNSPVMHRSVPDLYKPVIFERGMRVAFPAPTQAVKPLKLSRGQRA